MSLSFFGCFKHVEIMWNSNFLEIEVSSPFKLLLILFSVKFSYMHEKNIEKEKKRRKEERTMTVETYNITNKNDFFFSPINHSLLLPSSIFLLKVKWRNMQVWNLQIYDTHSSGSSHSIIGCCKKNQDAEWLVGRRTKNMQIYADWWNRMNELPNVNCIFFKLIWLI